MLDLTFVENITSMTNIRVPLSCLAVILAFASLETRAAVAEPVRNGTANGPVRDPAPSIGQEIAPAATDNRHPGDRTLCPNDPATGKAQSKQGPAQLIINPFVEQPDLPNSPPAHSKPLSPDQDPVEPRMIINPYYAKDDKLATRYTSHDHTGRESASDLPA